MNPDLERKKPVWLALSDFFLDTELDDKAMKYIASIIIQSGYSIKETKEILIEDLFPALLFNLHDVAGEWAGFPEEWLLKRIEETKEPNLAQRLHHKANFWMVKDYWNKLTEIIESERRACHNSGKPAS